MKFFEKHFPIRAYSRKQGYAWKFPENGQKMLKRAKLLKLCRKFNKILKYFGKGHVIARDYCTQ